MSSTLQPRTSDAAVLRATGRGRPDWFRRLDAWGAVDRPHRDIAAWLMRQHGVDGWWAQTLTVDYERARGLRPPGGSRDGTFSVGVSRTVDAPVERVFAAVMDGRTRRRWLPGARMRERTVQPLKSARFDWDGGATRVVVGFAPKGTSRSLVAVQHERLPDARAADRARTFWRERMTALKTMLER